MLNAAASGVGCTTYAMSLEGSAEPTQGLSGMPGTFVPRALIRGVLGSKSGSAEGALD